jgi:hypothetical protein
MGLAQINIKFSADLRGFSTEMQNSIRRIGAMGKQLQDTGRNLSTFVSPPLVAAGAAAVKFASDYEESVNKVNVAFGPASDSVKEFAKTSLESFGIAEGTALDMAATFGDMATALGLPVEKAAGMSKSLVGLAGDLASFKNISIDIANTALSGIFTGETESLKKLGIVMTEANLSAFALSQGINKQMKDMSQAEKVALRYNYILSVTKNSQGDFARTGGGAANQMRIFQESLKQVGQQLGAVILPVFTRLITFVNGAIKSFSGLSDETKTTIVAIAGVAAAIGPLLSVTGSLLTFVPNLITKFNALKDALIGLQTLIAANPYTALAVAIAAVAAGLFIWYSNSTKVVTAQESLNTAIAAGDKAATSEVATLDRLFTASTDVKKSVDERKAAYKSLQEIYPAYFKNIDFENLKNAQSIGIYKELRQAIFDKSRAVAIEGELQKRANERVEKELQLKEGIAKTEAEILRIKQGSDEVVLQEANAGEKTLRVTASKTDLLLAQNKLLKIQQNELKKFTEDALASDQILLDSKAEYDSKTTKLTENEIQRQKDLIAQNALQIESNNTLKANTIAYFESLISQAQKEQKEVATTSQAFGVLQNQIDGYQKKIDAISNKEFKLPKPEIPNADTSFDTPSLDNSLVGLKSQLAYFENLRDELSTTGQQYKAFDDTISGLQLQIKTIEGVDAAKEQIAELGTAAVTLQEEFNNAIEGVLEGFAAGIGEAIAAGFNSGDLLKSFSGLIFSTLGNMLMQLGKIAIATGTAVEAIKKSLTGLKGFGAIAAGVALIALGSIVKSQVASIGAFANGGIVGGQSFYGDKILARVNSGELILNNKQQRNLYGQLNSNSAQPIVLGGGFELSGDTVRLMLDRNEQKRGRIGG